MSTQAEPSVMFLGEHTHSLDGKGRIILPAKYREALSDAFLTSEVDGCLALWTPEEFELRAREMRERARGDAASRNMARAFFAGAQQANPDKQGRIAIPPTLREFAGLQHDVVVAGSFDHVEIWDAATWREKKRSGERGLAEGYQGG